MDKTAIFDAIEEVITEREGVHTAAEARLALLANAERHFLGGKDVCDCGERDTCEECMTEVEAVTMCKKLIADDDAQQAAIDAAIVAAQADGRIAPCDDAEFGMSP